MNEMTQRDADQLEAWVKDMSTEQLRLLWRWVMAAWAERMREEHPIERVKWTPSTVPGPPNYPVTHHGRTMHG